MQVIATAGHVDHGKSTLVRALTGMEPDRWAEERRRGMTIDLGYAWTRLPSGRQVAFVDVPGHERFGTNMLAGVGPVPAVLLVIAADDGWAVQTEEHVLALDALGVRLGIVAVTRSDLADPTPAAEQARARLAATSLAGIPTVSVSGTTGDGLDQLRTALDALADAVPPPDPRARIRLWVDRSFSIKGSGTVVTGTLGAGTLRTGDVLELGGAKVAIRALQCLGEAFDEVSAPARVAVNLRGLHHDHVRRGDALLTPGAWRTTGIVDVRFDGRDLPSHVLLHIGSAAMPARVRRIGPPDGAEPTILARLRLDSPLPLAIGDRVLVRDPGRRHTLGGATALDPAPPDLRRRGAARTRAALLRDGTGAPDLGVEIGRRRVARREFLVALGVAVPDPLPSGVIAAGDWVVDGGQWEQWRRQLYAVMDAPAQGSLVDAGAGHGDLVRTLGIPDGAVLDALLRTSPDLEAIAGRVRRRGAQPALRADLEASVSQLTDMLRHEPFSAPEQGRLQELGLGRHELGAAATAGAILRLPGDIVLLPGAPEDAAALLRTIPQPFTLSAARQALTTTRRVAVPLLEHMDRLGVTERVGDGLRRLRN